MPVVVAVLATTCFVRAGIALLRNVLTGLVTMEVGFDVDGDVDGDVDIAVVDIVEEMD